MGQYCGMRGMQPMSLNPKHLLFPGLFHPHSPPQNNGGHNTQVDTIAVGHQSLCTKQGPGGSSP